MLHKIPSNLIKDRFSHTEKSHNHGSERHLLWVKKLFRSLLNYGRNKNIVVLQFQICAEQHVRMVFAPIMAAFRTPAMCGSYSRTYWGT